jgi:hypothetical protein
MQNIKYNILTINTVEWQIKYVWNIWKKKLSYTSKYSNI